MSDTKYFPYVAEMLPLKVDAAELMPSFNHV
jgi:hypothetical protein